MCGARGLDSPPWQGGARGGSAEGGLNTKVREKGSLALAYPPPTPPFQGGEKDQQFSYFQLRRLPSAIHSTAWASRFARVSGLFASVTHSTYSRRHEGEKASNVAAALGSESSAARRSSGVASSGLGGFFGRGFGPASASDAARSISAFNSASGGRSSIEVKRPNWPIASRSEPVSPRTALAC